MGGAGEGALKTLPSTLPLNTQEGKAMEGRRPQVVENVRKSD